MVEGDRHGATLPVPAGDDHGQTIGGVHCCGAPLSCALLPPPSIAPEGVRMPLRRFATARFFVSVLSVLSTLSPEPPLAIAAFCVTVVVCTPTSTKSPSLTLPTS